MICCKHKRMNVTGDHISSPWGLRSHIDCDHIYDSILSLVWHMSVSKSWTDTTMLRNGSLSCIPHYESAWMLHHSTLTQQLEQATIPYTSVTNESYRNQWKTEGWSIPLYVSAPMKFTYHLSFKYNQQDATLYNILYYWQCCTCFGQFLRPSSRAQELYTQYLVCARLACHYH